MLDFFKPSFWFQKRTSVLDDARVRLEQMSQYNALFHLDPDKIVGAITAYNSGDLAQLAHIIRDIEQHDDKMATCSMKMRASVGRCDWSVLVKDGFENDARAKRHAEILKRFWSTVNVTSRFNQNERGGIRLLKKQMMEAQSFGYAVHEIVWKPLKNGEIAAEFIKLPLWHFENRTGSLRFLPTTTATEGVAMAEGEWLVTTGDGVGIPAAICAMAKRMSFQDWLLFSERSGMPIIVGKTGAAFGSDQWKNIKAAIRAIYRDTRVLLDRDSDITAIDTGHAANIPFPPLVEWADRAIAALYRGADLSTISKGDGTGASLQGDESGMIEQDAAANLGETLHEQVDRFVIRYVTGDDEPLAQIVIEPVTKPDVDTDIKIDMHLAGLGVKLSKADALQRYSRTEATSDDDALELPQNAPQMGLQGGLNGFPNEAQPKTPFKNDGKAFKNAQGVSDGQGDAQALKELVGAFSRDLGPAAEEVKKLLADLDAGKDVTEAAKSLVSRLPSLLPADPEGAAILAEAMAKAFAVTGASRPGEEKADLANENPYHCPRCGKFSGFNGHCDKCGYTLDAGETEKRAERLLNKSLDGTMFKPVEGLAYREGLGQIDLDVGKKGEGKGMEHGNGIAKIDQKHGNMISDLPRALAQGKVYRVRPGNDPSKPFDDTQRAIVHGNISVFLSEKRKGVWKIDSIYDNVKKVEKIERAAAV